MPPGAMSLKIQVVFLFFSSVENVQVNWFSGSRDVFFSSRANSTARCRRCFVAEFFHVYIVFLVVAIFAKTECYSPANLLVRSATYRTSATYQLSTCRKWYLASFLAFHDHFSHETYKHHASIVTCSESKWKNPPGQNDHSRQKQTTRWKYFSYQSSYWGMSTLVVPVLFNFCLDLANVTSRVDTYKELENNDSILGTRETFQLRRLSAWQFHTSHLSTFCELFLPCLHVTNPLQPLIEYL